MLPTGDLDCNPGVCPDWELNLSVGRASLNPLSHTTQGSSFSYNFYFLTINIRYILIFFYISGAKVLGTGLFCTSYDIMDTEPA